MKRSLLRFSFLFFLCLPFMFIRVPAQTPDPSTPPGTMSEDVAACMRCHGLGDREGTSNPFHKLQDSPHKDLDCTTCHSEFTADAPHTEAMKATRPACADCHPEPAEAYEKSVHANPDKVKGDHPRCATCHGGGDAHAVHIRGEWKRADKDKVCSNCHANKELMARYGPNTDAVESYNNSFHGKALLRFGNLKTAICADCHGMHDVKNVKDPASRVSTANVAKTCAQTGCHPGAGQNFSISGANHLTLRLHEEPLLNWILIFFRVLVFGMTSFLMIGVALDMRMALTGKNHTRCSKTVTVMVSVGFAILVVAIIMATLGTSGANALAFLGIGTVLASIPVHKYQIANKPKPENGRKFKRLTLSLRIQHLFLMIAFTVLVITGLPVRQAQDDFMRNFYMSIGGMEVGRWLHRVAGVMMISVFSFHVLELFFKWARARFSFKSWTMLPSTKDVKDFVQTSKYYVGKTDEAPKFGRFQFREKLDYFAEYWGIPLMGITGLILWFPVYWGNRLPDITIPAAYIAHSYEAVLAFLAILTWHMYNTHFNPHSFPMNPVWYTGTLTEADMRHEHALELEEILAKEGMAPTPEVPEAHSEPTPGEPHPESKPDQGDET